MFICYNPYYSFGGTSKIFDQHRWWSLCPHYSSCDEDDSTQSSIHNSYLLSSFYSHILWSKNMLLLSHYRFVTHQNVSSFLRNRLVQKIKILRIFLKIEICRRQSYGILLFNNHLLKSSILNPGAELRLFSLTLYYITKW